MLLTVNETAELLNVSTTTIRNWIDGDLPAWRFGNRIRVNPKDLHGTPVNEKAKPSPIQV